LATAFVFSIIASFCHWWQNETSEHGLLPSKSELLLLFWRQPEASINGSMTRLSGKIQCVDM
jgi:hypothetical protein